MEKRRKLFSTTNRRKLFSDNRRKLFSESSGAVGPNEVTVVICQDCGYKMETAAGTTNLICPNCGGTRFNPELCVYSPEVAPEKVPTQEREFSRRKLFSNELDEEAEFQKTFSEANNELEEKLKEFSGKELNLKEFEKQFSNITTKDYLEERGFCSTLENGCIKISDTAFLESRLFSKLIISVTRELNLDPEITNPCCDKESIIDRLSDSGDITPKGIILIKKAHCISPCSHENNWINDSGIINDLRLEFGGTSKSCPEFTKILEKRYPDAPINILDLLTKQGVIKISGDNIDINQ